MPQRGFRSPRWKRRSGGSAFLFSRDATDLDRDAEYARVARVLGMAEDWGVGERCAEGFGEVVVCHEFHNLVPSEEEL